MSRSSTSLTAELYQARAQYPFTGNTENELNLNRGDIVDVIEEDHPWALVRNSRNEDGYVPLDYLEAVAEPVEAAPPPPRPIIKNPTDRRAKVDLPPTPKAAAPNNSLPGGEGIFGRQKAESMDVGLSPYLDIFASSMEWWSCLTLFISGLLTVIWGSAEVPEDTQDEILGVVQAIGAGLLVAYFSLYRNSCGGDRAALIRSFVLSLMSVVCFLCLPLGGVGAGMLIPAALANLLAYCNGSDLHTADWLSSGLDLKAITKQLCKNPIVGVLFCILYIGANVGYFMLGLHLGQIKIDEEAEERVILGDAWKYAEGWATIIACNMVFTILFSMRSVYDYLTEYADVHAEDRDCCTKCFTRLINWASKESLFLLHKIFAGTILLAGIMHVFECINVYHSSGETKDYIGVFGDYAFAIGVPIIWCLCIIFAIFPVWDPVKEEGHQMLSHVSYTCWIVAVITPFFWGTNYWKFVSGPLVLYTVDKSFRKLVDCCYNVAPERESEYQ